MFQPKTPHLGTILKSSLKRRPLRSSWLKSLEFTYNCSNLNKYVAFWVVNHLLSIAIKVEDEIEEYAELKKEDEDEVNVILLDDAIDEKLEDYIYGDLELNEQLEYENNRLEYQIEEKEHDIEDKEE